MKYDAMNHSFPRSQLYRRKPLATPCYARVRPDCGPAFRRQLRNPSPSAADAPLEIARDFFSALGFAESHGRADRKRLILPGRRPALARFPRVRTSPSRRTGTTGTSSRVASSPIPARNGAMRPSRVSSPSGNTSTLHPAVNQIPANAKLLRKPAWRGSGKTLKIEVTKNVFHAARASPRKIPFPATGCASIPAARHPSPRPGAAATAPAVPRACKRDRNTSRGSRPPAPGRFDAAQIFAAAYARPSKNQHRGARQQFAYTATE